MAPITDLPFRAIPRQSKLFLDYLESSPAALRFYRYAPKTENLEAAARSIPAGMQFPRAEIAATLRRQNESYGCDAATLDGIAELEDPRCAAILTGQQVGLFAGPLYTIYKAATAVHIAGELKKIGIKAVPIFWMDSEDHDLAEVTHVSVLNPDASLERLDFRDIILGPKPACPVGSIRFPEAIAKTVRDYLGHFPETGDKSAIRDSLESAYRPGATFTQSFAELMSRIFRGSGLILFDPQDRQAKQLVSSVFQKALQMESEIRASLLRRNMELEGNGFHAQVSVLENSTVLFFIENGERRALEKRGDGRFGLKNAERSFTLDELLDCAIRDPEKFSPNVLLRPLIQDYLFPTAAYIGGPSELAYFAQIEVLYELYGRPMPVIWPRDSLTLIEPEPGAAMERLGVMLQDCFHGKQALAQKAVRNSGLSKASEKLDGLQERLDNTLTEVKPDLEAAEPPLAQALETARRKISHNVQQLRSRVIRMEEVRNSSLSGAIDMLMNSCYPNQNLQERELAIHHFLARRGSSALDEIRSAIRGGGFAHRVLWL